MSTPLRLLVVLVSMVLAACGGSKPRGSSAPTAARISAPPLFAHIPADTPYVIAALEAFPRAYMAKLADAFGPLLSTAFDKTLEETVEEDGETARLLQSIKIEFEGKLHADGLRTLGLSPEPRFALYGHGFMPVVFRIEIADEATLLATIERIAKRAGFALPTPEIRDGRRYWTGGDEEVTAIVTIADKQLVIAIGPRADVTKALPLILGITKPTASMADARELADVARRHRLAPYAIAYVDMRRMIDSVVVFEGHKPTPACSRELYHLASRAPRLVAGYREASPSRTTMVMTLELAPNLVRDIRDVRARVPGLRELFANEPFIAFAAAIDIAKTHNLLSRIAATLRDSGTHCDDEELVTAAEEVERFSIPERVQELTGFGIRVDTIEFDSGRIPSKLEAITIVGTTAPAALIAELAASVPWIGAERITANAGLVQVTLPFVPFSIHAGIGTEILVATAGTQSKELGARVLEARAHGTAPLIAASYDYGKFVALEGELARRGLLDEEDVAQHEYDAIVAPVFGRASGVLDISDVGLEMVMTYDMK